jgi:hypothetical protein
VTKSNIQFSVAMSYSFSFLGCGKTGKLRAGKKSVVGFGYLHHKDAVNRTGNDRQCTYSVTLRRVRVNIVDAEKQCYKF